MIETVNSGELILNSLIDLQRMNWFLHHLQKYQNV